MPAHINDCVACGARGQYTVLLALSGGDVSPVRYYIPNQHVRSEIGTALDVMEQVPFCRECIREVEGSLRGKIAEIQKANGISDKRGSA